MRRLGIAVLALGLCGGAATADPWRAHPRSALLAAEQAFRVTGAEAGPAGIRVHWQIAPGYYLYRERLRIRTEDGRAVKLVSPRAQSYPDAVLGTTGIYRLQLNALVKLKPKAPRPRRLLLRYQGCADAGLCYPPQQSEIAVTDTPH